MHANTSFRNRSGASTKWHKTFENMSFRPKVVTKQEMVSEEQTSKHSLMLAKTSIEVHLMHEFLPPELFLVF